MSSPSFYKAELCRPKAVKFHSALPVNLHTIFLSHRILYHVIASHAFPVYQLNMTVISRGTCTTLRTLRSSVLHSRAIYDTTPPQHLACRRAPNSAYLPRKEFSTMLPRQSGTPAPAQVREYDPEITDIASYVHHTPITSDLAVNSLSPHSNRHN